MAEYRIDELARLADASVRNIRVYQDRGLLAPPRRQGRVGIYSDAHLARLRLIGQLLKRGYTFANIAELLAARERDGLLLGEDLAQVAAVSRRLRPLAQTAVDALLAQGMSRHVQEALGHHFTAILEQIRQGSDAAVHSA